MGKNAANNERVGRPGGRGSGRAVKIAGVLVLLIFFGSVLYLYGTQEPVKPGPVTNISEDILGTPEAREWISGCEQRNSYIKAKCTNLFYYEFALKNNDESICGLINDDEMKKQCMRYFKLAG